MLGQTDVLIFPFFMNGPASEVSVARECAVPRAGVILPRCTSRAIGTGTVAVVPPTVTTARVEVGGIPRALTTFPGIRVLGEISFSEAPASGTSNVRDSVGTRSGRGKAATETTITAAKAATTATIRARTLTSLTRFPSISSANHLFKHYIMERLTK